MLSIFIDFKHAFYSMHVIFWWPQFCRSAVSHNTFYDEDKSGEKWFEIAAPKPDEFSVQSEKIISKIEISDCNLKSNKSTDYLWNTS